MTTIVDLASRYGLDGQTLLGRAYRCDDPRATLAPLDKLNTAHSIYVAGHRIATLAHVLRAIADDKPLPPVTLDFQGRLADGFHRLVISRALGAKDIPAVIETQEFVQCP